MPEVIEQEKELKQEALTVVQHSQSIVIVDQLTYNEASSLLLDRIIPFRKKWDEYWAPLRKAAWDAHKAIMQKFNDGDAPAEQAERIVKGKLRIWDEQQRKIEEESQRKAQEAAEALEREERLKAAVVAEQSGATEEEVTDIMETASVVVAVPVAPVYQRAVGVSVRENWKAYVMDIKKLCLAVAKGQVSPEYVLPNMTALNARAKADKQTMSIPGCIAKNEPIVAGRVK